MFEIEAAPDMILTMQADSARLSSESSSKQLEAELANAKSAAAQAAAAHKAASASWQSELALQKTEVCRHQRKAKTPMLLVMI